MEENDWHEGNERRADQHQTVHLIGELKMSLAVVKSKLEDVRDDIDKLITRAEFFPVKLIAYGIATSLFAAVLAAVLALVIRH